MAQALSGQTVAYEFLQLVGPMLSALGEIHYAKDAMDYCLRRPIPLPPFSGIAQRWMEDMTVETAEVVRVNRVIAVPIDLSSMDLFLDIDTLSARILRPAARRLVDLVSAAWPFGATMVVGNSEVPMGVHWAYSVFDPETNVAVRVIHAFDLVYRQFRTQADIRVGFSKSPVSVLSLSRYSALIAKRARLQEQHDRLRARKAGPRLFAPWERPSVPTSGLCRRQSDGVWRPV